MSNRAQRLEKLKARIAALDWTKEPANLDQYIQYTKDRFTIQTSAISLGYDEKDFSLDKACKSVVAFYTGHKFPQPARKTAKKIVTDVFNKMSSEEFNGFCQVLHERNALKQIIDNSFSHMPAHVKAKMEAWHKKNVRAEPEIPAAYAKIKVVEVEDLLPEGDAVVEGIKKTETAAPAESRSAGNEQQRVQWILDGLAEDNFTQDQITIFRDKKANVRTKSGNPYIVIDVKSPDKHFQIAVCETTGNRTYIIRKPIDFKNNETVTISDLKRDDAVFQESCYTREQWLGAIRLASYTPMEELGVQLKIPVAWHDKKDDLLKSLENYFNETGELPDRNSREPIKHGPLKGTTTWERAYWALRRETISGLESVHSLRAALIHHMPEAAYTLEKLGALARHFGIEDRVVFTGQVRDSKLYIRRFTVAVLCSESEGFSNSIIEYLQAGRPTVCTDTGGNAEVIQTGRNGFLIPIGDSKALADYVIRLFSDRTLARRIGEAGYESVRAYTHTRMVAEQMTCYDGVISANGGNRRNYRWSGRV